MCLSLIQLLSPLTFIIIILTILHRINCHFVRKGHKYNPGGEFLQRIQKLVHYQYNFALKDLSELLFLN